MTSRPGPVARRGGYAVLWVALGAAVGAVLALAGTVVIRAVSESAPAELGCHQPEPDGIRYCAYHSTQHGLFSDDYRLVVGTSANRGLFYQVPYPADKLKILWDNQTHGLLVEMPGSALTISADEYKDSR